jgi:hypothetical protein
MRVIRVGKENSRSADIMPVCLGSSRPEESPVKESSRRSPQNIMLRYSFTRSTTTAPSPPRRRQTRITLINGNRLVEF